jgi:lysophospholipid acyltransferase (LPLAT)-like uncharacterized protein
LRFVYFTSSVKIYGLENLKETVKSQKAVFAIWHGDLACLTMFFKKHILKFGDMCVLVSPSDDGAMLADVIEGLGGKTKAGDSRKKPVKALSSMIRAIRKEGCFAIFASDGPLGPRHVAKKGAVSCAYLSKVPVIAVASSAKRALRFKKTWDGFYLPLPFSKIVIEISGCLDAGKDTDESLLKLQAIMSELKTACDNKCG